MKVLIVGASSFIGGHLYQLLKKRTGLDVVGTYFSNRKDADFLCLDATDKPAVRDILKRVDPAMILLLAGNKNVKACERDLDQAWRQNVLPLKNIVEIISQDRMDTKVIFFSSDYVFDGNRGSYADIDEPSPVTNYGKTKLIAEKLLLASTVDGKVIRTSAVIGQGGVFWEWLRQVLRTQPECRMFSDVYFSPTSIDLLGDAIAYLIGNYEHTSERVIHVTNGQRMSRFQFALMCQKLMKETHARIIQDEGMGGFPHDLSLLASSIQEKMPVDSLENYVRGIING